MTQYIEIECFCPSLLIKMKGVDFHLWKIIQSLLVGKCSFSDFCCTLSRFYEKQHLFIIPSSTKYSSKPLWQHHTPSHTTSLHPFYSMLTATPALQFSSRRRILMVDLCGRGRIQYGFGQNSRLLDCEEWFVLIHHKMKC